jgi:hypothetical protein
MLIYSTKNLHYSGYEDLPNWVTITDPQLLRKWKCRQLKVLNSMHLSYNAEGAIPRTLFIKVFLK